MRRNYPTQCAAMIECAGWSCRDGIVVNHDFVGESFD